MNTDKISHNVQIDLWPEIMIQLSNGVPLPTKNWGDYEDISV
jgi:hypothetical protein